MCYMVYFRFISFRLVEKIPTIMFERSSALSLARINGIHFSRRGNDAIFLTETPFPSKPKPLFYILVLYIYIMCFLIFILFLWLFGFHLNLSVMVGRTLDQKWKFDYFPLYAVALRFLIMSSWKIYTFISFYKT